MEEREQSRGRRVPRWQPSPARPNNTLALERAGGAAGLSPRAWDHRGSLWDCAPTIKAGGGRGRGQGAGIRRQGEEGREQGYRDAEPLTLHGRLAQALPHSGAESSRALRRASPLSEYLTPLGVPGNASEWWSLGSRLWHRQHAASTAAPGQGAGGASRSERPRAPGWKAPLGQWWEGWGAGGSR